MGLRLHRLTGGNPTLDTRCSPGEPPSYATRQLWNDNPRTVRVLAVHAREILYLAAQCKPCTDIGKNLKPVVPASKRRPLLNCSEPNEEIRIVFGGPFTDEKDQDFHIRACIDCFSKYPTVEVFEKANGPNVIKFLDEYFHIHVVPRNIRLDHSRCIIGYNFENFCKQHNINIITAPANDHRAIGLVERLIQSIKRLLS